MLHHASPAHTMSPPHRKIRWRIVWLGLALIPFNNYWVFASLRWDQGFPTTMSLFFNTIFALAVLVPLNAILRRFAPRAALTQGELLVLYTMLSVASAICGHDLFEELLPISPQSDGWQQKKMSGRHSSIVISPIGSP